MTMLHVALAVVACGVGATLRYALGTLRSPQQWPWPTFTVNLVGTLVLGAAAELVDAGSIGVGPALVIGAGFAGGLTTFSTLAVDALQLWQGSRRRAVSYVTASGIAGTAAGLLGWVLAASLTA